MFVTESGREGSRLTHHHLTSGTRDLQNRGDEKVNQVEGVQ